MKTIKKLLPLLILISCLGVVYATTFSYTYDTATPAGSDDPAEADDRMREIKAAVQERENVDHYWPLTGTEVSDADAGEHKKVTLRVGSAPSAVADTIILKAIDVDGIAELHAIDENGNAIQLTSGGISSIGYTITAKTSDYPIVVGETKNNICFTNTGASAVVTFTLPTGVTGMRVQFLVTDTDGIRVLTPAGVSFRQLSFISTANKYVQSLVAGTFLDLIFDGTYWTNVGAVGGWTDE